MLPIANSLGDISRYLLKVFSLFLVLFFLLQKVQL